MAVVAVVFVELVERSAFVVWPSAEKAAVRIEAVVMARRVCKWRQFGFRNVLYSISARLLPIGNI